MYSTTTNDEKSIWTYLNCLNYLNYFKYKKYARLGSFDYENRQSLEIDGSTTQSLLDLEAGHQTTAENNASPNSPAYVDHTYTALRYSAYGLYGSTIFISAIQAFANSSHLFTCDSSPIEDGKWLGLLASGTIKNCPFPTKFAAHATIQLVLWTWLGVVCSLIMNLCIAAYYLRQAVTKFYNIEKPTEPSASQSTKRLYQYYFSNDPYANSDGNYCVGFDKNSWLNDLNFMVCFIAGTGISIVAAVTIVALNYYGDRGVAKALAGSNDGLFNTLYYTIVAVSSTITIFTRWISNINLCLQLSEWLGNAYTFYKSQKSINSLGTRRNACKIVFTIISFAIVSQVFGVFLKETQKGLDLLNWQNTLTVQVIGTIGHLGVYLNSWLSMPDMFLKFFEATHNMETYPRAFWCIVPMGMALLSGASIGDLALSQMDHKLVGAENWTIELCSWLSAGIINAKAELGIQKNYWEDKYGPTTQQEVQTWLAKLTGIFDLSRPVYDPANTQEHHNSNSPFSFYGGFDRNNTAPQTPSRPTMTQHGSRNFSSVASHKYKGPPLDPLTVEHDGTNGVSVLGSI